MSSAARNSSGLSGGEPDARLWPNAACIIRNRQSEDPTVGNRDKGKKEVKKPKKDAKIAGVVKEAPVPVAVEVVQRKRKDRVEASDA